MKVKYHNEEIDLDEKEVNGRYEFDFNDDLEKTIELNIQDINMEEDNHE